MAQHQHVLCGGAAGGATSEIEMIDQGYSARREKEISHFVRCNRTLCTAHWLWSVFEEKVAAGGRDLNTSRRVSLWPHNVVVEGLTEGDSGKLD